MKVTIPDHVLAQVPEEDREEFKKEVEETLKGAFTDPDFKLKPIRHLGDEAVCPDCKVGLVLVQTACLPDGHLVSLYDCPKCDEPFEGEAKN